MNIEVVFYYRNGSPARPAAFVGRYVPLTYWNDLACSAQVVASETRRAVESWNNNNSIEELDRERLLSAVSAISLDNGNRCFH